MQAHGDVTEPPEPYSRPRVAVIGLGYVGLPLAVELAKHREVLAFDIDCTRVAELKSGDDRTGEVTEEVLRDLPALKLSCTETDISDADIFIVTVPTPVDEANRPDLEPLKSATNLVARYVKPGALIIYESTVFPGATEEICGPIIERVSKLQLNRDFFLGYSPERINPGDKNHGLASITKIVSASTPAALVEVDALYSEIIAAGTHQAPSIQVAEAAKVIENVQRDVNIALMNEFSVLFERLGLDTQEVLTAAGTKWNFLPFNPGLVGGHCIGVDPYYLTHRAQEVGYHPEVILAGRRINDSMGSYVAQRLLQHMIREGHTVSDARVLIMGLAFKENCPDLRNTRVIDIVKHLEAYGVCVDVIDTWVDPAEAERVYGLKLVEPQRVRPEQYEGAVLAVPHTDLVEFADHFLDLASDRCAIFDVKGVLPKGRVHGRL